MYQLHHSSVQLENQFWIAETDSRAVCIFSANVKFCQVHNRTEELNGKAAQSHHTNSAGAEGITPYFCSTCSLAVEVRKEFGRST